jgi:hypothetical protein
VKRTNILLLSAICVAATSYGCSQGDVIPSIGVAGAPGGSLGSSGAPPSAGAATMSGGDASVAGAATSGGDTSVAGANTGVAGSGGTGTAGSGTAGSGTAGSGTAGSGTAGSGTAGSGTAGSGAVTPEAIVPTLDGFLWVGVCDSKAAGQGKDCPISSDSGTSNTSTTAPFASRGAFQARTHAVGGTPGVKYTINFEVRGVVGGKNYNNGTRRSTVQTPVEDLDTGNDGWYVGGVPTDTKWNTYEIHVTPPVTGQLVNTQALTCPTGVKCPTPPDNVYYANAILGGDGTHETYPVKFSASFPVLGGGTITLVMHDSNSLGQQNCGNNSSASALCSNPGPRIMSLSGLTPPPTPLSPISASQPYSQPAGTALFYPQWLAFDVKSVTQP